MYNKKALRDIVKNLGSAKAPTKKRDIIYDPMGQWTNPGQNTRVPTPNGNITMGANPETGQPIPFPVFAQPNVGPGVMMQPGQDYTFPGAKYVDEFPQVKKGGLVKQPKKYSKSLMAKNILFVKNALLKKKKSAKNKIFDPNSPYFQDGGTFEIELDDAEIDQYRRGGYIVEELDNYAEGGASEQKIIFSSKGGDCLKDEYWNGTKCVKIPKNTRIVYHTDKDVYDKAFAAESDSSHFYNNAKSDFNKIRALQSRIGTSVGNAAQDKARDAYFKEKDRQEKKWHTDNYKPGTTINHKYIGPKSNLKIKPVGLERNSDGYAFPKFKKPVVHNVYEEPIKEEEIDLRLPPLKSELLPQQNYELQGTYEEDQVPEYSPSYPENRIGYDKYNWYTTKSGLPKRQTNTGGFYPKYSKKVEEIKNYMEGYDDEDGNYIPGEIEKAKEEGRQIKFKGNVSKDDKEAQEKYIQEYGDYENLRNYQNQIMNLMQYNLNQKQYGGVLHKLQGGGSPYYSYGNKKYIKKNDGTWFVESNGEYVPITENVKARSAELNKNAKYNSNYNESQAFKDKLRKGAGKMYIPENQRYGAQAWNNYNDGPIDMVYPEKYIIGPGGGLLNQGLKTGVGTIEKLAATKIPGLFGTTVGQAAGAGFAADALVNQFPGAVSDIGKGEYLDAADKALWGTLGVTGLGLGKGMVSGVKNLGKFLGAESKALSNVDDVKLITNPTRSQQLDGEAFSIYKGNKNVGEISGTRSSNGDFIVSDVGVDAQFQKQGIGTQAYKQLNQSLGPGNKVKSWGAFVEDAGVAPGRNTWQSLEKQGLAKLNEKGIYEMLPKELPGSPNVSTTNNVDDLVDLWRIQEKNGKTFAQLAEEGKINPLFNNPATLAKKAEEEKYFGQWFTKDKNDFYFYKAVREFTNPEIINLKIPKSKLEQYSQYDKSLSRAPDREFVIPFEEQKLYKELPGSPNSFELFDLNNVRKPSGSIGNQGATPESANKILQSLNIKVKGASPNEVTLTEMVEHLKNNPKDAAKYKKFLENEPISVSELPGGEYQINDGHHRATLSYYSGNENIPAIIKNKGEYITQLPASPNTVDNVQKAGFLNPLALIDRVTPRLPAITKVLGMEDDVVNHSPLNLIPGYGKKLAQPGFTHPINSGNTEITAYRKFGNSLDDLKNSKTFRPQGGFRMGAKQIQTEGNWAESGIANENYKGVFAAGMDPRVAGTNIQLQRWSKRNGVVGMTKQGNPAIPITDPGLEFHRRLPFSNKYVPINKQKLIDNKFQLATQLPHVQSLIEKYGIAAAYGLISGYLANGKEGAVENLKTVNKYTVDPVINWSKKAWGDLENKLNQKEEGGYIDLDLDEDQINEYKNGGYIVEDISIPSLTRMDDGAQVKGSQGLNADFSTNLTAFINAAKADGIDLGIGSGFRSVEKQKQLWEQALKKYGSPEKARKWVAPPGK